MDRRSKHLSSEDRGVIFAKHNRGSNQRSIGQLLHRPARTICRELAQGRQEDGTYCPHEARLVYAARRARCCQRKLVEGSDLYRFAHGQRVQLHGSPEQVAPRLRVLKPDDPVGRMSREAIYAAIYAQPGGGLKAAMIGALRQAKPTRGAQTHDAGRQRHGLGNSAYYQPSQGHRGATGASPLASRRLLRNRLSADRKVT
jgi:IS30 family transposase